jgi:ParB family transcriptional regulator, chromosome partitioning protein
MAKRKTAAEILDTAHSIGNAIQLKDRAAEARAESEQSIKAAMPLDKILDRTQDTRNLQLQHVASLTESIAVLGLVEPLVVDRKGRLLAGGHRKAAIQLLKEQDLEAYAKHFPSDLVPVRAIDIDADRDPDRALQIEISENEKRRDYTASEVRALADRLRDAGYVDVKGRPAKDRKALRPALEVIVGKSIRTIRRYLNLEDPESRTNVRLLEDEREKAFPIQDLKRLRFALMRWQKASIGSDLVEIQSLSKDVTKLLKRVDSALVKIEN